MNPQIKLEEIKKIIEEWKPDLGLYSHEMVGLENVEWLIKRIEQLENALTSYKSGTDIDKKWCSIYMAQDKNEEEIRFLRENDIGDACSTKWFHGVVSGEYAKIMLDTMP